LGEDAGAVGRGVAAASVGRGFISKVAGRGAADGATGAPSTRRRLVSTTTVLDRPWLKLCFTVPELTAPVRGFRVSGARPPGRFSLSFASLIRSL